MNRRSRSISALFCSESRHHPEVTYLLNGLAELYLKQERHEEAELIYGRTLQIRRQARGPDHPGVAFSLHGRAELSMRRGNYEEAETLYQQALQIREPGPAAS